MAAPRASARAVKAGPAGRGVVVEPAAPTAEDASLLERGEHAAHALATRGDLARELLVRDHDLAPPRGQRAQPPRDAILERGPMQHLHLVAQAPEERAHVIEGAKR